MASEIRVNKIINRSGLSTVTFSDDGAIVSGIVSATVYTGSGANLTDLPAGNLSGTVSDARLSTVSSSKLSGALPALDGSALTGINTAFGNSSVNTTGIITATAFVSDTALSHRNIVINGAMTIAQRGTSSAGGEGYKTVDRFQYYKSGTNETPNQAQVDVASGTTPYSLGFRKAYQIENGNQSSAGSSDLVFLETNLEAQDIANSGWNYTSSSSYVTLSFWVKASVAMNYYGYLITVDGTAQRYTFETGSLSANTWTKVIKVIPGNSNLQFDNDNNKGLGIVWWPYLGDTYTNSSVTLNQWGAWSTGTRTPDYDRSSSGTWYMTDNATFEITGVQLEVGPVATPFEHRSVGEELSRCQRYCFILPQSHQGTSPNSQYVDMYIYHPTIMRAKPTVTQVSPQNIGGYDSNESGTYASRFYTNSGTPRLGSGTKFEAEI